MTLINKAEKKKKQLDVIQEMQEKSKPIEFGVSGTGLNGVTEVKPPRAPVRFKSTRPPLAVRN